MADCPYCGGHTGGCDSLSEFGFACTREMGHDGDHVACAGTGGHVVASWTDTGHGSGGTITLTSILDAKSAILQNSVSQPKRTPTLWSRDEPVRDEPTWESPTDSERAHAAAYMPGKATGHIIAWRWFELGWRDNEPRLSSITWSSHVWPCGEPAIGYDLNNGPYTTFGARPGIYTYKDRERAISEHDYSPPRYLAKVAIWGPMVEHEHGYRARYAYPVQLYHFETSSQETFIARELGKRYGVPVEQTTLHTGIETSVHGVLPIPNNSLPPGLAPRDVVRMEPDGSFWLDADFFQDLPLGTLDNLQHTGEYDHYQHTVRVRTKDTQSGPTAIHQMSSSSRVVGTALSGGKSDIVTVAMKDAAQDIMDDIHKTTLVDLGKLSSKENDDEV